MCACECVLGPKLTCVVPWQLGPTARLRERSITNHIATFQQEITSELAALTYEMASFLQMLV